MEVYIIRHGQSYNNLLMEDETLRVQDPHLTDLGVAQAEQLAAFLASAPNLEQLVRYPVDSRQRAEHHRHSFTHLYTSPMRRTLQTAQPLARALNLQPEIWVDIHEHGGIYLTQNGVTTGFGGLTRSQIQAEFPGYTLPEMITENGWWNPQDGFEDITLCRARAMRVARRLRERAQAENSADDRIALVTHGTFMDCLIKALFNRLPGDDHYHWHYNTAITRFDLLKDGGLILRYINRVSHLPPDCVT